MHRPIEISPWQVPDLQAPRVGALLCNFLDLASTSMGRATHYNSSEAQAQAEAAGHAQLFEFDRGLYTVLHLLPGVTDRARSLALRRLLATPRPQAAGHGTSLDDPRIEAAVIERLMSELPASRRLRLLASFAHAEPGQRRINNARARKLALRQVLGSRRLELWAVKYRAKLAKILVHAWGRKTASYLREALSTPVGERVPAQRRALERHIAKHAGPRARVARECVGFVLGARLEPTLPLLVAFEAAKLELGAGARLPLEVLEGIRSSYHPQVPRKTLLELGARSLSKTQRRQVQRRATALGVEVQLDPMDYDAVSLYIHAFAVGLDDAIVEALAHKAEQAAASFPAPHACVGLLIDASASMAGHGTQALRPMAIALALRDMLGATGSHARTVYCGGSFRAEDHAGLSAPEAFAGLCRPQGDTSLAAGLLELLERSEDEQGSLPEVVYIVSDGYENARAGRLDELIRALRELGIELPIYHLNPVFAAETAGEGRGVRSLSDQLPALAATRPDALGLAFLRAMTQAEPLRGVDALLRVALAKLGPSLVAPSPQHSLLVQTRGGEA